MKALAVFLAGLLASAALAQVTPTSQRAYPAVPSVLSGTSSAIGGGALLAGACASTTVTVTGATTSMLALATPATYPGDGNFWFAYVSSTNTVTLKVCGAIAITPASSTYLVKVFP